MKRLAVFVLLSAAACGGKIEGSSSDPSSSVDVFGAEPPSVPAVAEEPEWGVWQLMDATHELEVVIREPSNVYAWTCAVPVDGQRCPSTNRGRCMAGKLVLKGITWTFDLTDGTHPIGSGTIREEPSGDIRIEGTGLLPPNGRYRRVGASTKEACFI